jgi:2-oxoglutarate-dependent dioxygenase
MPPTSSVVRPLTLTENELYYYREYGYLLIPNFLDDAVVAPLREQVLDVLEANGVSRAQMDHASDTADKLRQNPQYLAGSLLDELINGANTIAIASQLIGGPAVRYLPFTAVKAGGGGGQFHFHQDNNYTQHDPALGSINIWVALVNMTPENGCLQMVPASHKAGVLDWENAGDGDAHRKVKLDPQTFLPIRMRAGDAVAFTRLTVHGSGPNHTSQARVAYGLQYHREDVKYFDVRDETWKLLVENRRFQTEPVAQLGPQ